MPNLDWTQIVLGILGLATSYWAYQMREYHKSVNSKLDEFLRLAKSAAKAEGILLGEEKEKQRRTTEDLQSEKDKNKES